MNDFSLICRFCMKTNVSFYSIFETIFTEDDNKFAKILPKELQESILFSLGLTVSEDDGFPQQLCDECLPKILSFVRFKKQCIMTLEDLTNKRQMKHNKLTKILCSDEYSSAMTCKIENIDEIKTETIVDEPSKICEVNIDETGHWNNDDTTNSSDGTPRTKHVSSCRLIKRSSKQHTISTLKQDLHKCPHCKQQFTKKGNLNRHVQIHVDVRQHKCHVCGKVFQQKVSLTRHMACHTDERSYLCNICAKRFNSVSNLNAHFRVHTKEKPYKCYQCNEAFAYRPALVKHLKTHNLIARPKVPLTKTTY